MKTKKTSTRLTKILALVLSLLMLLGAMPVALAATPVNPTIVEQPTFDRTVMMYGETFSALKIIGGKADVPGEFIFAAPTAFIQKTGTGFKVPLRFVPEDTVNYNTITVIPPTTVDVVQSTAARIEGTLSVNPLQVGQTLSQAEFVKSADFAMMNFNTKQNCTINWENPDKIMDKAGEYQEKVIISSDKGEEFIKPIEMMITVKVIGSVDEIAKIKEAPTASNIELGQTLADSALTGGLVTKGENPVAGKFAWKDSSIAPKVGTAKYTVVFTPDDPTACDPIETQVPVTTEKVAPEITWADELTATYVYNSLLEYHVIIGDEFTANIPGTFVVSKANTHQMKSINDTFNVTVQFIPEDKTNYETVSKEIPVKLVPDNPDCTAEGYMDTRGGDARKLAHWGAYISNKYNMEQATGKLYVVLDGEKTEVALPGEFFESTELTPGKHTVYSEYVPGENDVYEYDKSNEETFVVPAFSNVTVINGNGTTTKEYKAGDTVTVTATPHKKSYYDFTGWTAEGITLTEEEAAQQTLTFEMPENDVNLTANYKFNFKNFVKYIFEQLGVKLMALVQQGIEWIKGLRP